MRMLTTLSFLLLAACGQSGDLYLPPEQPGPAAEPAGSPTDGTVREPAAPTEAPPESESEPKPGDKDRK